ncbi:MAG: YraN family protein [Nitratireductor sp.]
MTGNELERKRAALARGRKGEWLAALALRLRGYRIVARNFRTKAGEIDIIARRGDLIVFVEVKARTNLAAAVDAVSHDSQRRISNAADYWISRQRDQARLSWRFDIIAVLPRRWPVHLEDAF